MKKIVVASQNPVKIRAVRDGFERMNVLDEETEIIGISAPSGVSDQPMTDEETYLGAKNRAEYIKKECKDADFWVGVEGGLYEKDGDMYAFAWIIVLSEHQKGEARTASFQIPPKVVALVRQGIELGKADDIVFGQHNSKHHLGSVGILTHGEIDRTALYEPAVCFALIPFINAEIWNEK
jgi:inosine/xanthosine triphosphatase